jgi:hypothetical protein
MSGRSAARSIDGAPVSAADLARVQAEQQLDLDRQRRTVRVVAGAAHDANDCRLLLSILGLGGAVVVDAARAAGPAQARKRRARAAA